jgi:hypothetical protein
MYPSGSMTLSLSVYAYERARPARLSQTVYVAMPRKAHVARNIR